MSPPSPQRKSLTIRREDQRRAFASPLRMELMGLFVDREPLSVADMAERMGRPASAIHYHVRVLEDAGLLQKQGERPKSRRPEALYLPVADVFLLEQGDAGSKNTSDAAMKTMTAALRMAERDMQAALQDPNAKSEGPHRNVLGIRFHCRLSKKELAELNRHLRGIDKMLAQSQKRSRPAPDDAFVSLTMALAPLRNRETSP